MPRLLCVVLLALPRLLCVVLLASPGRVLAQQCESPNVMIVLDRSGSMLELRKWSTAITAIDRITGSLEATMRFGLLPFPWGGDCAVDMPAAVLQAPALFNGGHIHDQLEAAAPDRFNKTPLDRAITAAAGFFDAHPDPTRRSIIIVITDGMETCDGAPEQAAGRALGAGYPVFVIGFGLGLDSRDLERVASFGGTRRAWSARTGRELFGALESIAAEIQVEVCDGLDNDCDGEVDEEIPQDPCSTACGDGFKICVDGRLTGCVGGDIPPEICNGQDDDCDGEVDEIPRVPCLSPQGDPGSQRCVNGAPAGECAPDRPEVCDGVDNDLDGRVDDLADERCAVDCHPGRRACVGGSLVACNALPVGPELCNGVDDDCDGEVDEGASCAGGEICEGGFCLPACPFNECPDGFQCRDHVCRTAPCVGGCAAPGRCVLGECRVDCVVDEDCPSGRCERRLCAPGGPVTAPPVGGQGGEGPAPPPAGGRGDAGGPSLAPVTPPPPAPAPDAGAAPVAGDAEVSSPAECNCRAGEGPGTPLPALVLLLLAALRRRSVGP